MKVACLWKIPNQDLNTDCDDPYGELGIYPRGELVGVFGDEDLAFEAKEEIQSERNNDEEGVGFPWKLMVDFQRVRQNTNAEIVQE